MPEIAEIKRGREIGRGGSRQTRSQKSIWHACEQCGKERWVALIKGSPENLSCRSCYLKSLKSREGDKHPNWKGGKIAKGGGYIQIRVYADDFFYPMANKLGYVSEHRLIVAKALNRCLLPWEVVHHKGAKYPQGSKANRSDNRYPENLELLPTRKYHLVDSVSRSLIGNLQKRVVLLEAENTLLKQQVREISTATKSFTG